MLVLVLLLYERLLTELWELNVEMKFDCFNVSYIDTNHQSGTFHQKMVSNYSREGYISLDSMLDIFVTQPSLDSPTFFYWQFDSIAALIAIIGQKVRKKVVIVGHNGDNPITPQPIEILDAL
jgi:hypothetical protein